MNKYIKMIEEYLSSFIVPALFALPMPALLSAFEKYIFNDWEFLNFLLVFMIIDTSLSWWYHIRNCTFSSKGFSMLFIKIIVYSVLLILAHGFGSFKVNGECVPAIQNFRIFICTTLFIREGISIVENLDKVYPNLLPKSIVKHLKGYLDKQTKRKEECQ